MASFVWMLLAEPTYNQTHLAALAWRARILGQKALRNVSRFSSSVGAFWSLARADNQKLPAARFFEATPSLRSRRVNARLSRSGPKTSIWAMGTGPLPLPVWEKIAKNRQHASDCFLAAFWPLRTANSHGTVIPLKTQLVYRV